MFLVLPTMKFSNEILYNSVHPFRAVPLTCIKTTEYSSMFISVCVYIVIITDNRKPTYKMLTQGWFPNFMHNFSTGDILKEQQLVLIPAVCFMCVVFIIGITGNILTIIIYGFRLTKPNSRYFILILACIDFFSCMVVIPFDVIDMLFPAAVYSIAICKIQQTGVYFTILSSVYTLVTIAFDRNRKICKPLVSQTATQRWWPTTIAILFLGCASSWPVLVLFGESNIPTGIGNLSYKICNIDSSFENAIYPNLFDGFYYAMFCISLTYIFTCYIHIWRTVKRHAKFLEQHANVVNTISEAISRTSDDSLKPVNDGGRTPARTARCKVAKLMFVVTLFLVISFVPHFITNVLLFRTPNCCNRMTRVQFMVIQITYRAPIINSASNAIIYTCMDTKYRYQLLLIFRCCWNTTKHRTSN